MVKIPLPDRIDLFPASRDWLNDMSVVHHYMHQRVHQKASPFGWAVSFDDQLYQPDGNPSGFIVFASVHFTKLKGEFGYDGLPTKWQVLLLSRLWLHDNLPHNSETCVIGKAMRLVQRRWIEVHPPRFPDQPYHIRKIISYADESRFLGTIYKASNFRNAGKGESRKRHKNTRGPGMENADLVRYIYDLKAPRWGVPSSTGGCMTKTITRRFGSGNREGHDSTAYYARKIHERSRIMKPTVASYTGDYDWANQVYLGDSQHMTQVPDDSVGLAFTSPPYSVGKDYDEDRTLYQQLDFMKRVSKEVHRTLVYGGRYIINMAGIGRRPYIPVQAHVQILMQDIGFLNLGEIVWRKATANRGNCSWGSWMKASAPSLRDVHEYLLVFCKGDFKRHDKGTSTISAKEFMLATTSCWDIQPESAKRIGHPAPFPVALAARAINLYSYQEDVVLDPFNGSGTTCVAAARAGRKYVGYDVVEEYVDLSRARLAKEDAHAG